MKRILFVHNNFPAQFRHAAAALANEPSIKLAAIGTGTSQRMPGVKLMKYSLSNPNVAATHPFARRFDLECRRAEEVLYAASSLAADGFVPDIVIGHPGWGETLPLRSVFPKAHHVAYCELFYRPEGADRGFDLEFPQTGIDGDVGLRAKNAATLLALVDCNSGISPTRWQRSTYPEEFQPKIKIIHEGVDVDRARPSANTKLKLPSGVTLTKDDEVVTYVSRCFEPVRGFHIFTRALPRIMAARPRAQILFIGGDGVPYGSPPPNGQTWKKMFFDEIAGRIDQKRIHFIGHTSHQDFLRALQISSAHIYLTYPFVLSWSMLEAMSTGCLVIASETPPVQEVLNSDNGILVPFFDFEQIADRVIEALAHPRRFKSIRAQARATVVNEYDMRRKCLPKMLDFLGVELTERSPEPDEPALVTSDGEV
jgi:glycosyltransferase involved in cell wall biosynthesis